MKKVGSRVLSLALCLMMVITCIPFSALPTASAAAVEPLTEANGYSTFGTTGTVTELDLGSRDDVVKLETTPHTDSTNTGSEEYGIRIPMDVVDKKLTFDFMYEGTFTSYDGVYTSLFRETASSFDGMGAAVMPAYSPNLMVNSYEPNLVAPQPSASTSLSAQTWYTMVAELTGHTLRMKLFPAGSTEPDAWTISHNVSAAYDLSASKDCSVIIKLADSTNNVDLYLDNVQVETAGDDQDENRIYTFMDENFEGFTADAALPATAYFTTPVGKVVASGEKNHGKVLEVTASNGANSFIVDVGQADKIVSFDFKYLSGSTFGSYGGLFVKSHCYNGGEDIYSVLSPAIGLRLSSAAESSGMSNGAGGVAEAPGNKPANNVWYSAKMLLQGNRYYLKLWTVGSQEPSDWTLSGQTTQSATSAGSQVKVEFVAPDSNNTTWIDNLKIQTFRAAVDEDFDSQTAGQAPASSQYTFTAGKATVQAVSGRGNVAEVDCAGNPTVTIPALQANKQLEFDFRFTSSTAGNSYPGLFVKPIFKKIGSTEHQIYAVFSDATGISSSNTPGGGQGGVALKSGLNAEANGILSKDYTFGTDWHSVKIVLEGSTIYTKVWKSGTAEPADWTVSATSAYVPETGVVDAVIQFVDPGNRLKIQLDDLKLSYLEQVPAGEADITVKCDSEILAVTGAGTYTVGTDATLTASVKEGYESIYAFAGWKSGNTIVSTSASYTFKVAADATYEAVYRTLTNEPGYTYYTDDFDGYLLGPATKETMPANYISFSELGEYEIAQEAGNAANQVLKAHTSSTSNANLFFMDCEIIDKEVSFDFRYTGAFAQWGGLYVKLHSQPSDTRPAGDQYYFSINPVFESEVIISCNESNIKRGNYGDASDTIDSGVWYSVKGRLVDNQIKLKIWPRSEAEPTEWTLSSPLTGFDPVAEGSSFGMELWNHADGSDVTVELDNISMKTWRKLAEKAQYTVAVSAEDDAMGTVKGGGTYLEGNMVKVSATPAKGYSFVGWKSGEEIVSTDAIYTFEAEANTTLVACFETTPVVIRSFMAAGLTQLAQIDETNKTVTLKFASDVDLSNVYPYFYLDAGVELAQDSYQKMDLSSGTATVGTGSQAWTIYATKNTVMTTFYVNGRTGNDSNDGLTSATAFKTLEQAKQAVRGISSWTGDVVVRIARGEYILEDTLEFGLEDSAAKGYAVIWQGTENANEVTISSAQYLDGTWTQSTDADLPTLDAGAVAWEYDATGLTYSRDLYVDGKMATLAGFVTDESQVGTWGRTDVSFMHMDTANKRYTVEGKLANMYAWRNPTDIEFCYEVSWTYSIVPITGITQSGSNSIVNMKADAFQALTTRAGTAGATCDPTSIINCFEGLSSVGEWYFDRTAQKIYYIAAAGADPNEMEMVIPMLDQLITVRGTEDSGSGASWVYGMTFKNMTFAYTSYIRPHTEGQIEAQASYCLDLDSVNWDYYHVHDYYQKTDGGVIASYVEGMRVQGCIFTNMSASAVDFEEGCVGCQVVANNITNVGANGVSIGGVAVRDAQPYSEYTYEKGIFKEVGADPDRVTQYNLIMSNYISGIGLSYKGAIGIFAGYVADTTISHNTITNASYSGISAGWGWGYWDGNGEIRNDQNAYDRAGSMQNSYYAFPETASIQMRYVIENNNISKVCQRLADGGAVYTLSMMPGSKLNGNVMHDNPIIFGGIYFDEATGGFSEIEDNILYNVHTTFNYHLVGGHTARQAAIYELMYSGLNYLGVAPGSSGADENYSAVTERSGYLPAATGLMPPAIQDVADLDEEAAQQVENMIDALDVVSLDDKAAVEAARAAYDALTDEQKALVENAEDLEAAEAAIEELEAAAADQAAADAVEALIAALDVASLEDKPAVAAARAAYEALTEKQKALVDNAADLEEAEAAIAELEAEAAADQAAADAVIELIDALDVTSLANKPAVAAARAAYEALTEKQKALVDNAADLEAAEAAIAELEAEAAAVEAMIAALPAAEDVTLEDKEAIEEAEEAYMDLTPAQRVLVENYDDLAAVRAAYDALKKAADDQAAADAVEALIDEIGEVTLESKADIEAARAAYDALTDEQKALVDNDDDLTAAEAKYEELVEEAEQEEIDEAAASAVEALIDEIGDVTLESKADIEAARAAYDALTDDQKALVDNDDDLTAAEAKYEELVEEAEQEEIDEAAASAVEELIDEIGEVTLSDKAAIEAARAAYDALTDAQKALVANYDALVAAEAELKQLIEDAFQDGSLILPDESEPLPLATPFKDITNHWAKNAIGFVYAMGLMNGVSDDEFDPEGTLTRAMVVTILYRLDNEPATSGKVPFSDVERGSWYAKAVQWASENNIVNGMGDGTFAPMENITREQVASILYRYAQYREESTGAKANLKGYSDAGQISGWASDAMAWAAAEGLVNGRTATTIVPKGTASRAEAATILERFCKLF